MNIQTIVKVISAVFGLLGVVFLFRIIGVGDEEIKMAASMGDFGVSFSFSFLIYCYFVITVVVTLLFSLLNLASSGQKLKKSLIFIGCFVVSMGSLCDFTGVETPLKDGEILSASGSRWVETGLRMFYLFSSIGHCSMVSIGGKKIFNR